MSERNKTDKEELYRLRSIFIHKCKDEKDLNKIYSYLHVCIDVNIVLKDMSE